ncbi:hypothetical protein F2Q68_00012139 [Brassica cretica]|uniref:Uncharacterized protein n=1 Tax=Brassica cretica TaxID=69181 RepID=A0A3N6RA76_BRACR|nr:hypothetical protein F2Q68_00012139 [Brassica cretica]
MITSLVALSFAIFATPSLDSVFLCMLCALGKLFIKLWFLGIWLPFFPTQSFVVLRWHERLVCACLVCEVFLISYLVVMLPTLSPLRDLERDIESRWFPPSSSFLVHGIDSGARWGCVVADEAQDVQYSGWRWVSSVFMVEFPVESGGLMIVILSPVGFRRRISVGEDGGSCCQHVSLFFERLTHCHRIFF